jgi:hypothetical protein
MPRVAPEPPHEAIPRRDYFPGVQVSASFSMRETVRVGVFMLINMFSILPPVPDFFV